MAKNKPGRTRIIYIQSSVKALPGFWSKGPGGMNIVGTFGSIRTEHLGGPAISRRFKTGKHIKGPLPFMDFGGPKIFLAPKVRGRPKGRNRAFPVFQVSSSITIKTNAGSSPTVRVSGAKKIISPLFLYRQNKGIPNLNGLSLL
jgi:hypothetical protein